MCEKVIYLISFVLVLALAGNALAATFQWDNGGDGPLWNVPENWNPDGVPSASDVAQVNIPDVNCLIDSYVTAECMVLDVGYNQGPSYLNMTGGTLTTSGNLQIGRMSDSNGVFIMSGGTATSTNGRLWVGYNSYGTLIMTGGEMNIAGDKIEVGKNASSNGVIYMHGGTMNFSGSSCDLEIGKYGTGIVTITAGEINVDDTIKLGQGGGTGRIYLYGGTINAGSDKLPMSATSVIDITEGTIVLEDKDDATPLINEYVGQGRIIGYGGLGRVVAIYDGSVTMVTGRMPDPELAWDPNPRNRTIAERDLVLSWTPGLYAVSHDVYFGNNFDDVNDANNAPGVWPEFKGNQDPCSFDPGLLDFGQTYYWRVDEVNDLDPNSPWKGVVWEFTVADYIVVEDFESYNDIPVEEQGSNLVYNTWKDGYVVNPSVNGSAIGYVVGSTLEAGNVHGGKQSVPLAYNNTIATYSEVTVNIDDLVISRDWTIDNFKVLSLWFYGDMLNSPTEQMYVKLNGVKVAYEGQLTDLQQITWQEWNVDLAAFGIDLSNVTELGIGFERTETFGGRGTILIDDIRLYISQDGQ